jgi:hypothetical protein
MKYVAIWEYDPENEAKVIAKFKSLPDFGIKRLSPPYCILGQKKGFSIIEAENPEQIEEFTHYYVDVLDFEILPLIEVAKAVPIREK